MDPVKHEVLDHGYVSLVESWGSDERIIESARMSTQRGFDGWGPKHSDNCLNQTVPLGSWTCVCNPSPGDEKLLRFLWENKHTTPFEMAGATLEVKAPIFVFREWHRHRTQSYNEASSRYSPLPPDDYLPTFERVMQRGTGTRQAKPADGAIELTEDNARRWLARTEEVYAIVEEHYQLGLKIGIPKELARITMAVGRYSTMRASANLLNWFRFESLRLPEDAQWEIRAYAGAVAETLSDCFPRSSALFGEGLLREHDGTRAEAMRLRLERENNKAEGLVPPKAG